MSVGKLYAGNELAAKRVLITAQWTGLKLDVPPFVSGTDNKTPEFLQKSPLGKAPVLETSEGFIFESNAICKHLARLAPRSGLLGRSDFEASQVDQWLELASNELEPSALTWLGPILGHIAFNEKLNQQARENIATVTKALNQYLERHQFLVGERITLADIVVASVLFPLYQKVLEPRLRNPIQNLNRWFETITQQPAFKAVVNLAPSMWCTVPQPPIKFEPKAAPAAPEKKEAPAEKAPKAEKSEKAEKPPKAEKPKAEKAEAEKPPKADKKKKKDDDDDEEEDDDAPKEEKIKDPVDLLPKSSFILDQFKREYSNSKIEDSFKYLWDNFDPEGYSLWYSNYKFNDECTVLFRTTNLVGGFFQRLEKMHKYAFGQMVICGEEKQHDLSGFWIIRGQELPVTLLDVADTELYDWVKIDFANVEAEKPTILNILKWESDANGKPCLDGKTFK